MQVVGIVLKPLSATVLRPHCPLLQRERERKEHQNNGDMSIPEPAKRTVPYHLWRTE